MSEQKLSNNAAISAIVVSTLGCGITLMPSVFNLLGNYLVLALMTVIGIMTFFSIYFLSYSAIASKEKDDSDSKISYTGLAAKFSPILKIVVAFSLCFGSLLTTFSFVQTFIKILLNTLNYNESLLAFVKENTTIIRTLISACIAIIYYFLFQLDNLSSFAVFSNFSLFTVLIFSLSVAFFGLYNPVSSEKLVKSTGNINIVDPIGVVIFALHCQFSFLDIFNSMKDNSLCNVRSVVLKASVFATLLYTAVGYLGYKAVGNDIGSGSLLFAFAENKNILESLESRYGLYFGRHLPKLVHSLFCPVFFVGILFNMFSILPDLQNGLSYGRSKQVSRKTIALISALFVFCSGIRKISNLDSLFSISGFLMTNPLSFLFPAVFMLYTTSKMNIATVTARLMIGISLTIMIGLTFLYLKSNFFS